MAAPRATQFIALRNLSRTASQLRSLHMTGPATYASPLHAGENPAVNLPTDLAGLRAACMRSKINASGSKQELTARLNADHLIHTRAFTTAAQTHKTAPHPNTRHINTSRTLKALHDTSTIDFAHFPTSAELSPTIPETFRVPILPDSYSSTSSLAAEADDVPVMKPEISTMSADAVFLPMADMHDGHAMGVDFHEMAEKVAMGLRQAGLATGGKVTREEQASIMKRVWGDLVDDVVSGLGKVVKK